jgi:hypothetical protein
MGRAGLVGAGSEGGILRDVVVYWGYSKSLKPGASYEEFPHLPVKV